jgi:transaldolase
MTKLHDLYNNYSQSPWLDNIKRTWLKDGTLKNLIDDGVRGLTSNPTIFAKSIESSSDYDEQFNNLLKENFPVEEAYWKLVEDDIREALALLRPIYDSSESKDGFVSLEVSPLFANDYPNTIAQARLLANEIAEPNLLIKIPATTAGLGAIKDMIIDGNNVNVTLIFSIERYREVIEAYISGLEARIEMGVFDLSNVCSVASFFISRIDTEVDLRLNSINSSESKELLGRTAISQAKVAYQEFLSAFNSSRFQELKNFGAQEQRLLWASTSTKNPAYSDLLYVENLIGPQTVNTMPDQTLKAVLDHGNLDETLTKDVDEAYEILNKLNKVGVDINDVTDKLEIDGVKAFSDSFNEVIETLRKKAGQ